MFYLLKKGILQAVKCKKVQVFNSDVYLLTHWIRTGNVELFAGQKVFDVSVELQLKYLSSISNEVMHAKWKKSSDGSIEIDK